jgi:hypothetical protein
LKQHTCLPKMLMTVQGCRDRKVPGRDWQSRRLDVADCARPTTLFLHAHKDRQCASRLPSLLLSALAVTHRRLRDSSTILTDATTSVRRRSITPASLVFLAPEGRSEPAAPSRRPRRAPQPVCSPPLRCCTRPNPTTGPCACANRTDAWPAEGGHLPKAAGYDFQRHELRPFHIAPAEF